MRRRLIQTGDTAQRARGEAFLRTLTTRFILLVIPFSILMLFDSDRAVKPIGTFSILFGEATPWPPSPVRRGKTTRSEIIHTHNSEEEPSSAGAIKNKGHQHDHELSLLGQSRPVELPSEAHYANEAGGVSPPFNLPVGVREGKEALLDVTLSDRRVFAGTKSEGLVESSLPLALHYEGPTRTSRRKGDGTVLSSITESEIGLNPHEKSVSDLDSDEKSDEDVAPLPPPHVDPRLLRLGRRRVPRQKQKQRSVDVLNGKKGESISHNTGTYPPLNEDIKGEEKGNSAVARSAGRGGRDSLRILETFKGRHSEQSGQNEHSMRLLLSLHEVQPEPYEAPTAERAPFPLSRGAPPVGVAEGFPMAEERGEKKEKKKVAAHPEIHPRILPKLTRVPTEHQQQGNFEEDSIDGLKVFKAAEDAVNDQQDPPSSPPVNMENESPPSFPPPSPQINNEGAGGGLAALNFSGFEGLLGANGTSSSSSSTSSSFPSSYSKSSSSAFSSSSSFSNDEGSGSATMTLTTSTSTSTPNPTTPPYMGPCIPCPEYGLSPYEQLKLNMSNGVAHIVKYAINASNNEWGYEAVRYCSPCNTSGGLTYVMKPAVEGELVACIVGALMGIVASVGYILSLRFCCKKTLRGRKDGGVGKAPRGMMATAEDEEMTLTPGERMGMGDRGAVEEFAENYQQQQQQQQQMMLMQMMGMMNTASPNQRISSANGGRSGGAPPATRALPPGGGGGGGRASPSAVPPSPAPRG